MKKLLLTVYCLLLTAYCFPQQPTLNWAFKLSPGKAYLISDLACDEQNNLYVLGEFYGEMDADPSASQTMLYHSENNGAHFIAKYTPQGNLVWAKKLSTHTNYNPSGLEIFENSLYLNGMFSGTTDFGLGAAGMVITASAYWQTFSLEMDLNGYVIRCDVLDEGQGPILNLHGYTHGYYYVAENLTNETTITVPGRTFTYLPEYYDIAIYQQPDSALENIWVKFIGGPGIQNVTALLADYKTSDVIVAGTFSSPTDFNPGSELAQLTNTGSSDIFMLRLNEKGEFIWVKQLSGSSYKGITDMAVAANGNIFVSGYFEGSIDFDPSANEKIFTEKGRDGDAFVASYSPDGALRWVEVFASEYKDEAMAIELDYEGGLIVAGKFQETIDFAPGTQTRELTAEREQLFLIKLNQ